MIGEVDAHGKRDDSERSVHKDGEKDAGGRKRIEARALVYDPAYENVPGANGPSLPSPGGRRPFVALADAWARAKAQAAAALSRGEVPPEYRPLVRRFFELD